MTIDLNRVTQLHQEDRELLRVKNAAYGNTGLRQTGLEGIATRVIDKAHRLLTLARNPDLDTGDEAIQDTLRDVSNYGILGRMLDHESLLNRPVSVYLAGPIDLALPEQARNWRVQARAILTHYGVASFDPFAAWSGGGNPEAKQLVMAIDYFAVENCDLTLAHLPANIPTLGTVREIERARSKDRRVVVASPWAGTSAFSADLECYTTIPEALCAILEIDPGEYNALVSQIYGSGTGEFSDTPYNVAVDLSIDSVFSTEHEDCFVGGDGDNTRGKEVENGQGDELGSPLQGSDSSSRWPSSENAR